MRENHLVITRIDGDYNYEIANSRGKFIARVNWLNVGGVRVAFGEGETEFGGPVTIDLSNTHKDDQTRASGAFIERTE